MPPNERKVRAARELWRREPARMRRAVSRNAIKSGAWSRERFALDDALAATEDVVAALDERARSLQGKAIR